MSTWPNSLSPWGHLGQPAPTLPTPAFAVLLPSRTKALFLQHGRSLVLPLFTSYDAVTDFLYAARMRRNWPFELPTVAAVAEFLRAPPGCTGDPAGLVVAIDPTDPMRPTGLCEARKLLASLQPAQPPARERSLRLH